MYSKIVSERLKIARNAQELRQVDVFLKTGITQEKISRLESGISQPDMDTLGTLIELYEISADWLFGFEETDHTIRLKNVPIFRK